MDQLFLTTDGMATLTHAGLMVHSALEQMFLSWAAANGAMNVRYPALIRVLDLDCLNYFRNFPHLLYCACSLDAAVHSSHGRRKHDITAVSRSDLGDGEFCLPPAACYNVYLGLRGQDLTSPQYVTTVATCFRNEDEYDGLQRLRAFSLREMVCVGTAEAVKDHLARYKRLVLEFLDCLRLPIKVETASDPFFDKQGKAARASRIMPTKEEILYRGKLAIGSVNYHRRFFGERCRISMNGDTAHTGCVGFGLERWVHALADHYGSDAEAILGALKSAQLKLGSASRQEAL